MDNKKKDLEIIKRLFDDILSMYEKVLPIWKTEDLESLKKYTETQNDAAEIPFHIIPLLIATKAASFSKITLEKFPKKEITELVDPEILAFDLITQHLDFDAVLQRHRRAVYFAAALFVLRDEYHKRLNKENYGKKAVEGDLLGTRPKALEELLEEREEIRSEPKGIKRAKKIRDKLDEIKTLSRNDDSAGPLNYEIYHDLKEELSADAIPLREYLPDNLPDELRAFITKVCDQCDPGKAKLLSDAAAGHFRLLIIRAKQAYAKAIRDLKTKKRGYGYDEVKMQAVEDQSEHDFINDPDIQDEFKTKEAYIESQKNKAARLSYAKSLNIDGVLTAENEDGKEVPANDTPYSCETAFVKLNAKESRERLTEEQSNVIEYIHEAESLKRLHVGYGVSEKTFRNIIDKIAMKFDIEIEDDKMDLATYRKRKKKKRK